MITIYDSFESLIMEHSQRALTSINKDHVKKELKIGACLIPGVDKFMSLIDFGSSVNENLTREKILRFLSKVNPQVDNQIIEEINNSSKYRNTVGTTLLELIDRIDSEVKPEILGNLFNSFSNKEISYPTLLKAAHILNMVFYIDLIHLKEYYDGEYITSPVDASLSTYGLVQSNVDFAAQLSEVISLDKDSSKKHSEEYKHEKDTLTLMGKILINIGLKDIV